MGTAGFMHASAVASRKRVPAPRFSAPFPHRRGRKQYVGSSRGERKSTRGCCCHVVKWGPRFREDDTIRFCLTRGADGDAGREVVVHVR